MRSSSHHPLQPSLHCHRVLVAATLTLTVVACGGGDDGDATATTLTANPVTETTPVPEPTAAPGTTEARSAESLPPGCPDPASVAQLVGAPVDPGFSAGGRSGTSGVSYSFEGCAYFVADSGGEVVIDRLQVEGDGFAFDILSDDTRLAAEEDGFEPVEDLGDEAWRDGTTYAVRQGPSMVFAEVIPAPGDSPGVAGSLSAILAEAVLPLDLTAPPAERCGAVEGAVADALGPVESLNESQGGVMVNEVSFETSGCRLELVDGAEAIVDVADAEPWDAWVTAKDASSSGGYEGLTIGQLSAFDTGDELVVDDGDEPLRITTEGLDLDDGEAKTLRLDLAELALGS